MKYWQRWWEIFATLTKPNIMAAVDYFLKIDGIQGESRDDKHKDEIDIESFSWGRRRAAPLPAAAAGDPAKSQCRISISPCW